jgi:hypothetical protein
MKGFNLSSYKSVGSSIDLCKFYSEIGCDTIRHQLVNIDEQTLTNRAKYVAWLEKETEDMIQIAYTAGLYGLKFIADLHNTYGGVVAQPRNNPISAVFLNDEMEEYWRQDFQTVASKVERCPYIFAIELMNEPNARVHQYAKFLLRNRDFMRSCTTKRIYVSSVYGEPLRLEYLPKMGKGFFPTVHFWPTPTSLIGAGGFVANGREETVIRKGLHLGGLTIAKQYNQTHQRKVLVGEIGCTRGIGDELQVRYMQKSLRYALKNKLNILVHGEAGNPHYGYEETGVLEVVRKCFTGK